MSTKTKGKLTAGQKRAREHKLTLARPGVIHDIQTILTEAQDKGKMVTTEDILTRLAKKHPDRDEQGMLITVRAQLSRLPKEKNFPIAKKREGQKVYYAAA